MFNWVGAQLDDILSNYVLDVVKALMSGLAPVALACMTLWVTLYGWAVLRNEASETVPVFLWKVVKIGLVLALSLQSGLYVTYIADTANALAMGIATTFVPAGIDAATVTSPYALLDKFNDDASAQVADIMKEASLFRTDLLIATAIFSFGSVAFLCIALFVVTLSKLFLTFLIAIGPLFLMSLAWRPTARFFDSWLSMMLNAVVLTWFAFFALGLSSFVGTSVFKAIQDGGGFLGDNFNVLGEATRYCVLMVLMAILCFQAPGLASALTGGAAVQQGIQMVQNTLMVAGLRSVSAARSGSGAAQGGVVRGGGGVGYAAGRVAGAILHAGRVTPRAPAYRLAASRGRV